MAEWHVYFGGEGGIRGEAAGRRERNGLRAVTAEPNSDCLTEKRREKDVKKKELNILFIGNSHTYYNDMPMMVKHRAEEEGYCCRVTMLAHGGWFLHQHAAGQEARFNILYGGYDYVVLPFGPEEPFLEAAAALTKTIREAGSTPVIYECWAKKNEPENQAHMNEVHRRVAKEIGALFAPVGENWWDYQASRPDLELYAEDGAHASRAGSDLAAKHIWTAIRDDLSRKERQAREKN